MNIIFFSDAGNVTFKCIFSGEDYLCFFWQKGNIIFVTFIHIHKNIIFPSIFWERSTFPHITKKIIFQYDLFFKKKHYISLYFFRERPSFLFRLKNKIIFSGKRNIIFSDNARKIIFQRNFIGKIIFPEYLEKENMIFRAV